MSLASGCPDRGRIVRSSLTSTRVEGRKQYTIPTLEDVPQFKCRLELPSESESQTGGYRRTYSEPTLIAVKRDLAGNPVLIKASDQIEVESRELGNTTWNVMGDPKPLRRRRSIVGWEATLVRVEGDTPEED